MNFTNKIIPETNLVLDNDDSAVIEVQKVENPPKDNDKPKPKKSNGVVNYLFYFFVIASILCFLWNIYYSYNYFKSPYSKKILVDLLSSSFSK